MNDTHIQTERLLLALQSPDEARASVKGLSPEQKKELSPAWLARLEAATVPDPWVHGFVLRHRDTDECIGSVGFKGPPTAEGVVEIAYGIEPDHQSKGYATEAVAAGTAHALNLKHVRNVCAHTLPEAKASARVLSKCGFRFLGEVMDPEDGLVWRWEKADTEHLVKGA